MRILWLSVAFILSSILAILQYFAVYNYLYWRFVWFDVPMHFLGGATIAAFLVALLMHFRPRLFVVGVVIISLGWEGFELLSGFPRESNFVFDTSLDLLMDALGAIVVYVIARKTVWRSK